MDLLDGIGVCCMLRLAHMRKKTDKARFVSILKFEEPKPNRGVNKTLSAVLKSQLCHAK
jgi:hypothetical protein